MAKITVAGPDYGFFNMPGNPVGVQALTYSSPAEAEAAAGTITGTEGPTVDFPMPNGQVRQLTRGDILFYKQLANSILLGLRAATGIPWPLIP